LKSSIEKEEEEAEAEAEEEEGEICRTAYCAIK